MSRGRKPKGKVQDSDWGTIFNRNVGYYFQTILIELGTYFQIEADETESGQFLLEQIRTKIKSKIYANIEDNEIPFKIPEHWVWCRLGEMSINRDGERRPISQAERGGRDKIYDYYGASGIIDKIDGFTHEGEYLLIGEDGANLVSRSTPIAFIVNGRFWVNNHAHVIETLDRETLEFLCYFFNAIDLKPFITGGFQPKLSQGNLNRIPIPLPPLSEQRNIVNFLRDMKSADIRSEGFYFDKAVEQKILKLHNAQITGSGISTELTHQLSLVQKLRQQLLQEAVQGKLVPQDPNDEPAGILLQKIKAEKERLVKEKKIKKDKDLPEIKAEEIPFEIPEGWVWCRLGEIAEIVRGGSPRPAGDKRFYDGAIPFLKVGDLTGYEDKYCTTHNHTIKEAGLHKTRFVDADTLMLTNSGATLGIPRICTFPTTFNDGIAAFLNLSNISKVFLFYFLKSKSDWFLKQASRGQGQPNLNTSIIADTLLPLPPLAEQHRIVQKLEQLLQVCDALQASIQESRGYNEQLLQQVLREALKGE